MDLRQCFDGITRFASEVTLDSFEVVKEVEKYRELWRPDKSRIILLAESHVHTSDEDFAHRWSYFADPTHQGYFVRFVYCLANGEKNLVNIPSNKGTWQFWKIFYSCLNKQSGNRDSAPFLRHSTPDFNQRMEAKIGLLQSLKQAGIWLMDASIVGINGLDPTNKAKVLQHCWKNYVGPKLASLDPLPRHIIVIGSGVEQTLRDKIDGLGIEHSMILQPQAHLVGGYSQYYEKCFEICSTFWN